MSNLAPSISLIPSALMNSSHLCKYRLKLWICSQRLGAQGWLWGLLIWNLAIVFLDFDFTLSFVMGMQTLKVNWACTQNSICYFQETEESGELFIFMHLRQNNCSAALSEYFGKSKSGDSGTSFLCLLFQITQKNHLLRDCHITNFVYLSGFKPKCCSYITWKYLQEIYSNQ